MFKDKKQSYCTWVLHFGTFHWRFFKTTWNNHIQGFVEQMALYLSLSISTIYISPTNSGVGRISLTFLACLLTGFSVQARSQSSFPCEQGCLRLFCAQSKVRGLVLRANHSEEPVCLQSHSLENWSRITCSYNWCCSHTLLFSIGGFILIQCSSFPKAVMGFHLQLNHSFDFCNYNCPCRTARSDSYVVFLSCRI